MVVPLYVGTIGAVLRLTVLEDGEAKDVSTATSLEFEIRKPDGTTDTVTASFESDGTDGRLIYVFEDGDLDVAGDYFARVFFTLGGFTGRTTEYAFPVKAV